MGHTDWSESFRIQSAGQKLDIVLKGTKVGDGLCNLLGAVLGQGVELVYGLRGCAYFAA